MPFLNLGVLAHVDAGKTTLTERLLFQAGALDALGSVDAGTTRTDSMELERRRGITIRTAVATFDVGPLTVNLIDTPGHSDFVAEVERALTVLDAAVLVVSAVEGVQPQTAVLWRALERLGVARIVLVNKVDRLGADADAVIEQIRCRLTPDVLPLAQVTLSGRRDAAVTPLSLDDPTVTDVIFERDEGLMRRWASGQRLRDGELLRVARREVAAGRLTPVLIGSALTGAGIDLLMDAFSELLPAAPDPSAGRPAGVVFAVQREDGRRRCLIRLAGGRLTIRDRVAVGRRRAATVTGLWSSSPKGMQPVESATSGEIVAVAGLDDARIGDEFGRVVHRRARPTLGRPVFDVVVEPVDPDERTPMYAALAELADIDPLLGLRRVDGDVIVSVYGEVQQEVLAAILADEHRIGVRFGSVGIACVERITRVGEAVEQLGLDGNPYLATIGLRVESAAPGHGVEFRPGIERGRLVPAFIAATEEGVRAALAQGSHGWPVVDALVTMTASKYCPRQSHAHQRFNKAMSSIGTDFRNLAPVVVAAALRRAGTVVCEPIHRFELDAPVDALGPIGGLLARHGASITATSPDRDRLRCVGEVPAASVGSITRLLPDIGNGEAAFATEPSHDRPIAGAPPHRRRRGPDPAERLAWFRDVPR